MKRLISIVLILVAACHYAGAQDPPPEPPPSVPPPATDLAFSERDPGVEVFPISFEWDANTEPDLAGYRIYKSRVLGEYDKWAIQIMCIEQHPEWECTSATLTVTAPGKYYFVATAYDNDDNESAYSDAVSHTFYASPKAPGGIRQKD